MGKNKKKQPLVSICTPTFNRRPFIQTMFQCFRNQTYPKESMEWIIVDDGTDKIKDLIDAANIPQIKYFALDEKMRLGAKRNFMHQKTSGSILVYMDDDDYYPPERVQHAVDRLQEKPEALCAGSSEIYVYFKHIQKMYQGGPYGPNHATAGTFAFRRELLSQSQYEDEAALAEEKAFLKNYTIPFVQLDPLKTILVFSHIQNTFDKRKLLEKEHGHFFKESPKTVDMFIKFEYETPIKDYFMDHIDKALETYKPGDPSMKPDVLTQMVELNKKRETMMKEAMERQKNANGQIMMQQPGMPPRPLMPQELVQLIQQQQQEINKRGEKVTQLERLVSEMQKKLAIMYKEKKEGEKETVSVAESEPKSSARIQITETNDVGTQTINLEEDLKDLPHSHKKIEKRVVMYQTETFSKITPEVMVTIP